MKSGGIHSKNGIDQQVKNRVDGRVLALPKVGKMKKNGFPASLVNKRIFQNLPGVIPSKLKTVEEIGVIDKEANEGNRPNYRPFAITNR